MSLNPDVTKQAQEVVFSGKSQKMPHPTIYFNFLVMCSSGQNCLAIYLDEKFDFNNRTEEKIPKDYKSISVSE